MLVVALAVGGAGCLPAAASAQQQTGIEIQHHVEADGGGSLIANPVPYGRGTIFWASCAHGGPVCVSVPRAPDTGRRLETGDPPAGTAFEARVAEGGQVLAARSAQWRGAVRATAPPGIAGSPRANAFVRPLPATWEGGWGSEASYLQLQVCRTAAARRCVAISDSVYWDRCPGTGATIAPRYAGWYLRAVDRRNVRDMPRLAIAYAAAERVPLTEPAPAAAATAPVRIRPASGPPRRRCGRSRRYGEASLLPRAIRRGGRSAIGRVTCIGRCRLKVAVGRGAGRRPLRYARPTATVVDRPLVLPRRLRRAARGTRRVVVVSIDGRRAAARRVTFPRARRGHR